MPTVTIDQRSLPFERITPLKDPSTFLETAKHNDTCDVLIQSDKGDYFVASDRVRRVFDTGGRVQLGDGTAGKVVRLEYDPRTETLENIIPISGAMGAILTANGVGVLAGKIARGVTAKTALVSVSGAQTPVGLWAAQSVTVAQKSAIQFVGNRGDLMVAGASIALGAAVLATGGYALHRYMKAHQEQVQHDQAVTSK